MRFNADENILLSVIVPAYNEEENIGFLYEHLKPILEKVSENKHEIILIDDGSTDGTLKAMSRLYEKDETVKVLSLRRNFGKAQALAAGFELARGKYIFTLDADMQDDPEEIPRFLEKMEEGYDMVIGWKAQRNDPLVKVISSRFFNWTNSRIFGLMLHDINCGFKAYGRDVIEETELYGELHRYIPIIAHSKGFKVTEIKVKHNPRRYGKTKYNWRRYFAGFFDLLTSIVITRFAKKPLHFFGSFGSVFFLAGMIICGVLTWEWFHKKWIGDRPLLTLGVLLLIIGMQVIMIGLIGEIIINRDEKRINRPPVRKLLSRCPEDHDDKCTQ